jgi:hydrogenase maturation protease
MGVVPPVLLIGVGNEYRSDDGLGIYAVREIGRRGIPGVVIAEQNGEGAALMDAWQGYDRVFIVDAINSGGASGSMLRIDALAEELPAHFFHYSSHAFGVIEAIQMARVLERLPHLLVLYGIEGKQFDLGPGLTDAVLKNITPMLSSIEHELRSLTGNHMEMHE